MDPMSCFFVAFLMLHHYLHFRSSLVHCQSVFDLAILVVTTTICGEKPVFQGTLNGITEAIFLYHVLLLDPPRRPLSPKPRRDSMYSQFSLADFCSSMSSSYVKLFLNDDRGLLVKLLIMSFDDLTADVVSLCVVLVHKIKYV